MRFGSLFSGIGGFDLGFERAGMTCAWQVEIDEKARDVLGCHWPNVPKYEDVKNVGRHNLEPVDLVCGGFPCQDLSVAGQRAGLAGERSGLWFEFHRILAEIKPRWVVIENVPGLLSSNKGRDFAVILSGLVKLGYGVCWRILDAQYFGVPQRRRRVFIVGSLGDGRSAQVLFEREGSAWDPPPSRESGQGFARDVAPCLAASGRGTERTGESRGQDAVIVIRNSGRDCDTRPGRTGTTTQEDVMYSLQAEQQHAIAFQPRYARNGRRAPDTIAAPLTAEVGRTGKGDSTQCVAIQLTGDRDNPYVSIYDEVYPTLRANPSSDRRASVAAGTTWGVRRLTPTECERLQGFPDGHTAGQSDSARYRQLGNAVEVDCAEWIGHQLIAALG